MSGIYVLPNTVVHSRAVLIEARISNVHQQIFRCEVGYICTFVEGRNNHYKQEVLYTPKDP